MTYLHTSEQNNYYINSFLGGTAIASPVATAIAGLSPSDLAALGLPTNLAQKMKKDGFEVIYESSNYPFIRPNDWNTHRPTNVNDDDETRIVNGEDILNDGGGNAREQFLSDIYKNQYNWPYNPYDLYMPVY